MSDWTRAGDVDADIPIEPAIGDLWRKKGTAGADGLAHVTDVVPFTPKDQPPKPITRVCVLIVVGHQEKREWHDAAEFRKKFVLRRRA